MIPRIIHYCWFGRGRMPQYALRCIASWHKYMPDWEYVLWNEDNFDVSRHPYTREAYEAGLFAFVSDVARLYALKERGGVYLDVDFEVYKPFDDLLQNDAFAGFEGTKHNPVMMGVIGSIPGSQWVIKQLERYDDRHFIVDGRPDLTTNVRFITDGMIEQGFIPNGQEQDCLDMHVYPVDYFCPRLTTGEYKKTSNTFCEQVNEESSWAVVSPKDRIFRRLPTWLRVALIKTKRALLG